jgi:hypothetical protein
VFLLIACMSARDHDGEIIFFKLQQIQETIVTTTFLGGSLNPHLHYCISLVSRNKIGMATFQIFNHTIVSYVRR